VAPKKKERAAWEVEFCSVPLSREDVEAAKKWDVNYSLTMKACDNALFKACKISLSYQQNTSSYIASCTVPHPESGQQKKCFTSHAPEMMDALKLMAFKITTVLDDDVFNLHNVASSQEAWG
jgi:hypothetical protein